MARTIQDNQRDSMEEKEVYKNMKNNKEIIFDLADTIYFDFIDTLDNKTRAKFIIKDIDNKDGTINTEKGRELYYLIEDRIKKAFNKLPSKRIKELKLINQSHKDLNGSLRTELKEHKEEERIRQDNKKEWERITKL
jgi:hypothetical protein